MKPAAGTLRVYDDAAALARAGADFLIETANKTEGRVIVAMSGGSTPKPLYQLLGEEPAKSLMPWDRVHWLLGDERFVAWDDPASNYGMARAAFLGHVPVPEENVHPVPFENINFEQAAEEYENMLKKLYGSAELRADQPLLDVNLLGLGPDGHTASLIPGEPVLEVTDRWVAGVGHGRPEKRITLTYPALNSSRVVVFLVAGEEKREILDRVLSGDTTVPAGRIRPVGDIIWFTDRAAAGRWAG